MTFNIVIGLSTTDITHFNNTFDVNFFSGIDELGLAHPDLCRHLFLHLQLQLKQKRPAQAERPARYFSDEVESDSAKPTGTQNINQFGIKNTKSN